MTHSYFARLFIFISLCLLSAQLTYASEPDYGIYWFGEGDVSQKSIKGQSNPYYNKYKPTILFAIGWQPDAYKTTQKVSFKFHGEDFGEDTYFADEWIKAGWNVGRFEWSAFADEDMVTAAEAKVWSAYGPKRMRYRLSDGSYKEFSQKKSVTALLRDAYVDAMSDYKGNNIRIAGASLGNQVAIRISEKIRQGLKNGTISNTRLMPKRIALLDPYYTAVPRAFLGGLTTSMWAAIHMQNLRNEGVIFENYSSTVIANLELSGRIRDLSAYQNLKPWYTDLLQIEAKHEAAAYWYFSSFADDPPEEYMRLLLLRKTGDMALSAATPDWRVREMMKSNYYWDQIRGKYTIETSDDEFIRCLKED